MIRTVAPDELESVSAPYEGAQMNLTNYLGSYDRLDRGPQAFIVDVDARCKVDPHWHSIDQFQLFVRGDSIGKVPMEGAATVFYTDGYTPYGPLNGSDDGLKFFNLRARADLDAHYMPGARNDMLRRPGRMIIAHVQPAELGAPMEMRQTTLIGPDEDGLLAVDTVVGPGEPLSEDLVGGAGRYEFVLAGSLVMEGRTYGADSVIFADPATVLPPRCAGDQGAQVITLQSPTE